MKNLIYVSCFILAFGYTLAESTIETSLGATSVMPSDSVSPSMSQSMRMSISPSKSVEPSASVSPSVGPTQPTMTTGATTTPSSSNYINLSSALFFGSLVAGMMKFMFA